MSENKKNVEVEVLAENVESHESKVTDSEKKEFINSLISFLVGCPLSIWISGFVLEGINNIFLSYGLIEMATASLVHNGVVETVEFLTFTTSATGWHVFFYYLLFFGAIILTTIVVMVIVTYIVENWEMIVAKMKETVKNIVTHVKGWFNKEPKTIVVK